MDFYNKSKNFLSFRLAVNRLKLLEKKNTELALKARKEIADYIAAGKAERGYNTFLSTCYCSSICQHFFIFPAKIRVEQIIREDYLVEAMEILEMYCDLLLARFGLVQQMKTLDEGLSEAISSLIWVAPRMLADVAELKIIAEQLGVKYGKPYSLACRDNAIGTVAPKLMHKLSVQAPPKILVEKYLIEIAKNYNVFYEPDPQVMNHCLVSQFVLLLWLFKKQIMREAAAAEEALLIDFNATEAGKMGGAVGWVHPGQPVAGAVGGPPQGWMPPPQAGYAPYPGGAYGPPMGVMSPPPPYGYPLPPSYQQEEKPPLASAPHPVTDEKKPSSFNIPPNNLGGNSNSSSKDNSPTGNSKPLNTNLQVVCSTNNCY